MKKIKKVEVTPIDRNIGKIVDSTATQDDKTKNTYSMRIIDQKTSDLISETIPIKVRGRLSNGQINYNSSSDGLIFFQKRGGMIYARFGIGQVQTVGELFLFNQDGTEFSVPARFKPISSAYPKAYHNFNRSDSTKLIEASVATGEVKINDEVIFSGTFISFNDFSGITVQGNISFMYSLTYMDSQDDGDDFQYELGDINRDGQVNENDLQLLRSYLVGHTTLTPTQLQLADMNSDGQVNETDAILLAIKINTNS